MRELHGRTREWNGITCLAMYHPAFILRTPTAEMRRIYADDFRLIPKLLEQARQKHQAVAAALTAGLPEVEGVAQLDQLPLF